MTPIKGTIECSRCSERIPVTAYPKIAVETPQGVRAEEGGGAQEVQTGGKMMDIFRRLQKASESLHESMADIDNAPGRWWQKG